MVMMIILIIMENGTVAPCTMGPEAIEAAPFARASPSEGHAGVSDLITIRAESFEGRDRQTIQLSDMM
jgi:hypothetical protein